MQTDHLWWGREIDTREDRVRRQQQYAEELRQQIAERALQNKASFAETAPVKPVAQVERLPPPQEMARTINPQRSIPVHTKPVQRYQMADTIRSRITEAQLSSTQPVMTKIRMPQQPNPSFASSFEDTTFDFTIKPFPKGRSSRINQVTMQRASTIRDDATVSSAPIRDEEPSIFDHSMISTPHQGFSVRHRQMDGPKPGGGRTEGRKSWNATRGARWADRELPQTKAKFMYSSHDF